MLSTGKRSTARRSPARPGDGSNGHSGSGRNQFRSASERYEVMGRAGEGTLFAVYRVRDRSSGRIHALKALKNAFVKHPQLTGNLNRVVEQSLEFNHPYIARTSDVGMAEGTLYLVSEWLPGQTLEERLRHSPLPHTEALLFTRQIAEALNFLRTNGMAHGDLRPRQIFLASGTHLKVSDPGIGEALHQSGITNFDIQPDAAHFLAPERFDGAPPSAAADFYALGVILYQMLTGRLPFDGPSPLVIAARHRGDVPLRPSQFNPECSPQLEELALRLLEKHPQTRLQAAQELLRQMGGGDSPVYESPYTVLNQPQSAAAPTLPPVAPVAPVAPAVTPPAAPPVVPVAPVIVDEPDYQPFPTEADEDEPIAEQAIDLKMARGKQRRREFWGAVLALFWFLMAVGLLGGMSYGAYYFWLAGIPKEVRVPKYAGMQREEAEQVLQRAGLRLKVGSEKYNPRIAQDTILTGDPPAGKKVRQGREVIVVLSKGEEPIKMYDFKELSLKRAREIITRDGMRLGLVTEQYHDRIPAGYVAGQYPEPGAPFRRSEQINLTVSKGTPPTTMDMPQSEPLPPPPVPNVLPDDTPSFSAEEAPDVPMVSRSIAIRVALPKTAAAQEVRIVVNDAGGEDVVYQEMHDPGDLIDETVTVRREQGTTAQIRVYIGGKLFREQRI
jgi:serine/threonine-protein kinase